ncbi:MAG: translation elongation factor 4 [Christensenellales bacterium]|jgi:GTP-binding protein LepA|nr:translation elongation factor 4 [Eubacteriales bacterium]
MDNRRQKIRNFCIVAHIDHGKSTLADRLIESTGTVQKRDMSAQLLDNMDLERERGITIKLQTCRILYTLDGETYTLNLIDTPGHVDFTYEVSRSLAACEGAVLVVDATQGIEAQTLTNVYLALSNNLEIIPVINKIDLASARPDEIKKEIEEVIGLDAESAPLISAKEGINIDKVLEQIVRLLPPPPPKYSQDNPLSALIFDSFYDNYRGAISMVRIFDGKVKTGDRIKIFSTGKVFDVVEVGCFTPKMTPLAELSAGDVGYIAASIKNVKDVAVGDTITTAEKGVKEPLPGYRPALAMVFAGIYPADGAHYGDLKDALEKLNLNDAALHYEPEVSQALGFGFRCGFLGLLHMEVIVERLEREFDLDLITTAPSVSYRVTKTNGETLMVDNPTHLPDPSTIDFMEEPIVLVTLYSPAEYVGPIMELCQEKRGTFLNMDYIDKTRVKIEYTMPLNEIVYDFFDTLKSATRGYASYDYESRGFQKSDLVKLDILLNGEACDALSIIVHRDNAYARGRSIAEKLRDAIPRQQFEIPIQAAIGGKIIARETVKAVRKDVLAKCYGGDITRKKKLLEKQKEGKKRMRQVGSVQVPSEAFMSILKLN